MTEMQALGPSALVIRRIHAVLATLGLAAASVVLVAMGDRFDLALPWWPFALVVVVAGLYGWWWAGVVHARWAWRLTDDLFEVMHGVVVHQTALVPRSRIQNVTTSAGPLQTRFGVVTLTVHTAGARTRNVSVEHIDVGHAEAMRRRLGLT
jgi:membrane protein YdbS with pleckstrin-like domain